MRGTCLQIQVVAGRDSATAPSSGEIKINRHRSCKILKRDTTIKGLPGEGALEDAASIVDSARAGLSPGRRDGEEEKNRVAETKHWNMEVMWIKMLVLIKSGAFSK